MRDTLAECGFLWTLPSNRSVVGCLRRRFRCLTCQRPGSQTIRGLEVVREDTTVCPAIGVRTMWHSSEHPRTRRHQGGFDPFELAIVGRGALDDLAGGAASPKIWS